MAPALSFQGVAGHPRLAKHAVHGRDFQKPIPNNGGHHLNLGSRAAVASADSFPIFLSHSVGGLVMPEVWASEHRCGFRFVDSALRPFGSLTQVGHRHEVVLLLSGKALKHSNRSAAERLIHRGWRRWREFCPLECLCRSGSFWVRAQ